MANKCYLIEAFYLSIKENKKTKIHVVDSFSAIIRLKLIIIRYQTYRHILPLYLRMMSCRLSGVPAIPFLGPLRRPGYCLGGCLDRHDEPIPKLPYLFSCLNISASTCRE